MSSSALATVGTLTTKPACSTPWLVLFTLSSLVALVLSVAGLVLVLRSHGPRLDMNISTVLRDSYYGSGPLYGGSYLSDSERSRLLGETRVRIGDVWPDEGVGYIGITATDPGVNGGRVVGRLKPGRLYH
jgi:hypothetical protein